jgi:hypothetical protein
VHWPCCRAAPPLQGLPSFSISASTPPHARTHGGKSVLPSALLPPTSPSNPSVGFKIAAQPCLGPFGWDCTSFGSAAAGLRRQCGAAAPRAKARLGRHTRRERGQGGPPPQARLASARPCGESTAQADSRHAISGPHLPSQHPALPFRLRSGTHPFPMIPEYPPPPHHHHHHHRPPAQISPTPPHTLP